MLTKCKPVLSLLALTLMLGAFLFPIAAYAETADITPPTVSAALNGDMLLVTTKDSGSGVDSVYVAQHRFPTLADGTARLRFADYAGTADQQVAVSATDVAGNRSEPVLIDNPYYVAPATPTPVPTRTPPASTAPVPASSATPSVESLPTAEPPPTAIPTPTPTSFLPTALPEPRPPSGDPSGSAIPGGTNPLTPDGGGTVQDNATGEEGKEFFTVTTAAGNVYYLVIDRQRGSENVYFLSPVTEEDLLGMTESGAVVEPIPAQPQPSEEPPEPSEPPQEEPPARSGVNVGTIIFILLAAAAVGGFAYYIKIVKPRKQAATDDEYEEDLEGEEPGEDEYIFEDDAAGGARNAGN